MSYCFYYTRKDENKESIDKVKSTSRLKAAKYFAERKQLPLKEFLKIWGVGKEGIL